MIKRDYMSNILKIKNLMIRKKNFNIIGKIFNVTFIKGVTMIALFA